MKTPCIYLFGKDSKKEEYYINKITNKNTEKYSFDGETFKQALNEEVLFLSYIGFLSSFDILIDFIVSTDYTLDEERIIKNFLNKNIYKEKNLKNNLLFVLDNSLLWNEKYKKKDIQYIINQIKITDKIECFNDIKKLLLKIEDISLLLEIYLKALYKEGNQKKSKKEVSFKKGKNNGIKDTPLF